MKSNYLYFIIISSLLLLIGCQNNGDKMEAKNIEKHYSGKQLIVSFNSDIKQDVATKLLKDKNLSVIKHMKAANAYLVSIENNQSVEDIVKHLTQLSSVRYAEPNHQMKPTK